MNPRVADAVDLVHQLGGSAHSFNDRVAQRITSAVGTMACAYLFAVIALISLPAAIGSGDVIVIVGWVAQTFLQLVLLSIILVGQRLQADSHADLHAKVDALHAKVAPRITYVSGNTLRDSGA